MSKYTGTWSEFLMYAVGFILIMSVVIGSWVVSSHFEAKAFNSATGKKISTWDAMWIELRVQEGTTDASGSE